MSGGHHVNEQRRGRRVLVGLGCVLALVLAACSNDPYPPEPPGEKILYSSFTEAPRTLDPATAYTTVAHSITGAVYGTLLEYHFLKRPLELIPGLAIALPEVEDLGEGRSRYRFQLREGLLFADDDCFALSTPDARTREVVMGDVAFQLMRLADPKVGSPVIEPFANIEGFQAFGEALAERRGADETFAALPVHEQYAAIGGIRGLATPSPYTLEVTLHRPYPQIRYWFAMEFSTPVPWEAIAWYDGQDGRPRFDDHPVGTGPFYLAEYDKHARYVLEKNPNWFGVRNPDWRAPSAVFPEPADEEDVASGAFNFYRCLVNRHGPERAPEEMAAVIVSAEREYARLEERLSRDDPELARRYRERCAQATEEGLPGRQVQVPADPSSPVDSRPMGKWEMPPPIADERAWRERTT